MGKTVFEDGNPSLGILGTRVLAAFLNKIFNHRHDGRDEDGSAPSNYATDTGTANAYVIALTPPLSAHVTGMQLMFYALAANTGASTLAVDGLAPAEIVDMGGNALSVGAIRQGGLVCVVWDGARYCMTSPPATQTSGGGFVGQVAWTAAAVPPAGWLECNGELVSRTTYANLFATIGTTYGAGDGATTFRLPEIRGEHIMGWDHGRGIDPGRALGSWQADQVKAHNHSCPGVNELGDGAVFERAPGPGDGNLVTGTTGGTQNRVRSVALMAVIKV